MHDFYVHEYIVCVYTYAHIHICMYTYVHIRICYWVCKSPPFSHILHGLMKTPVKS